MRRRDPITLTPRELEVLELLKRGYSNRGIAQELQISLDGAKYHVSEIISKLGVSSREEAATWHERRWGLLPAVFASWRRFSLGELSMKLVAAGAATSAIAMAVVLAVSGSHPGADDGSLVALQPTPTPEFPCPDPGESCVRILHVELASWEEAASYSSTPLLEPAYLPEGYERDKLIYSYSDPPVERPGVYTQVISAKFVGPDGNDLLVNQGFGPSLNNDRYSVAPDEYRGGLVVNGTQLFWVNGNSVWEERADGWHATEEWDLESLDVYTLTWQEPKTGPIVWEKSPDGKVTYHRSGDAVGYLIHATGLPLEELIKIAESMLAE